MFVKLFRRAQAMIVYALTLSLLLAVAACQPIHAPIAPAVEASQPPGGMTVAFVRNKALYVQQRDVTTAVEDCTIGCQVHYLT